MTGIIIVDKPQGMTSQDVVGKVRRIFGQREVGHGGTLDPMATGVLPVFLGRATRASAYTLESDKTYAARLKFGIVTDTQDVTGTVVEKSGTVPTLEKVKKVLPQFRGTIQQTPPMYSAVKVNGKKLYELARKGIEVERTAREVMIYRLELLLESPFGTVPGEDELDILVSCSKGTYIRTLGEEIGKACECGAALSALRRLNAHGFDIAEAHTLEELEQMKAENRLPEAVRPVDSIFSDLKALTLNEDGTQRIRRGAPVYLYEAPGKYRLYEQNGTFLGIGNVRETDRRPELMIERGFFEV